MSRCVLSNMRDVCGGGLWSPWSFCTCISSQIFFSLAYSLSLNFLTSVCLALLSFAIPLLTLTFSSFWLFRMEFSDWCRWFSRVSICRIVNTSAISLSKTWHEKMFHGKWQGRSAGGCVNHRDTFLHNQQVSAMAIASVTASVGVKRGQESGAEWGRKQQLFFVGQGLSIHVVKTLARTMMCTCIAQVLSVGLCLYRVCMFFSMHSQWHARSRRWWSASCSRIRVAASLGKVERTSPLGAWSWRFVVHIFVFAWVFMHG